MGWAEKKKAGTKLASLLSTCAYFSSWLNSLSHHFVYSHVRALRSRNSIKQKQEGRDGSLTTSLWRGDAHLCAAFSCLQHALRRRAAFTPYACHRSLYALRARAGLFCALLYLLARSPRAALTLQQKHHLFMGSLFCACSGAHRITFPVHLYLLSRSALAAAFAPAQRRSRTRLAVHSLLCFSFSIVSVLLELLPAAGGAASLARQPLRRSAVRAYWTARI